MGGDAFLELINEPPNDLRRVNAVSFWVGKWWEAESCASSGLGLVDEAIAEVGMECVVDSNVLYSDRDVLRSR